MKDPQPPDTNLAAKAMMERLEAIRERASKRLSNTILGGWFLAPRGPRKVTSYHGPLHRGDGFDQQRLERAATKRARRRARNLRISR